MFLHLLQFNYEDKNYNICRNVENVHVLTLIKSTNQSCSNVQRSVTKKTCWFAIQLITNCSLSLQQSSKWRCWFGKDIFFSFVCVHLRPPLWSSGQSFWLQIQRSRVRSPALPDFLSSSGSGTGSSQPREPREVNWRATWMKKVAVPGLENRD